MADPFYYMQLILLKRNRHFKCGNAF